MSSCLHEDSIDVEACVAKIRRLAAALAETSAAYGLDVPEGCDGSIPYAAPDTTTGCAKCAEPLAAYAPVGARAHQICAEPEGSFLDGAGRVIPEPVAVASPAVDLRPLLAEALAANEARPSRLISIAGVVRWLAEKASPRASLEDVHRELLAAVERRELELRAVEPSALTRRGDAELCPPGPRGTVLAFGKRLVIPPAPRCARCGRVEFAPVHDPGAHGADAHAFEARAAERRAL